MWYLLWFSFLTLIMNLGFSFIAGVVSYLMGAEFAVAYLWNELLSFLGGVLLAIELRSAERFCLSWCFGIIWVWIVIICAAAAARWRGPAVVRERISWMPGDGWKVLKPRHGGVDAATASAVGCGERRRFACRLIGIFGICGATKHRTEKTHKSRCVLRWFIANWLVFIVFDWLSFGIGFLILVVFG